MSRSFKLLFLLLLLYSISYVFIPKKNNVCKTFTDYYFPEGNDNCYHDPDMTLEMSELIEKYAGIVEIHNVTTEDGYILTMFRIPRNNPRGVILIHHSIATHSRIYLLQGNDSFAMTLWRNGFEVWLANQRGTLYSDQHVNMTKYDFSYWNFSFHEMGLYDVTSELELIREKTNGSKVIFYGHSLGGALGLTYSSLKPLEAQKYLKYSVLVSPANHFRYNSFHVKFVLRHSNKFGVLMNFFKMGSPLVHISFIRRFLRVLTQAFPPAQFIIAAFVSIVCGYTPEEVDPAFYNFDAGVYMDTFSSKTVYHFGQLLDDFKMYDYGVEENLKLYGQATAPLYPIEKILVPTVIISSDKDILITQQDCDDIYKRLTPVENHCHLKLSGLNHLDFLNGIHRKELFLDKLMKILLNISECTEPYNMCKQV